MSIPASVLIITCLTVVGCTSASTRYLQDAKGQATQDDLVQRLGLPHTEKALSNGSAWAYRSTVAYLDKDGGHSVCGETILTFNDGKVLQDWKNKGC